MASYYGGIHRKVRFIMVFVAITDSIWIRISGDRINTNKNRIMTVSRFSVVCKSSR